MQNDKFRRKYNIVCAIDDNYVPLCGIMLTSLFKSNPGCYFSVYVLTKGLKDVNKARLNSIFDRNQEVCHGEINICEIDDSVIKDVPVRLHSHFTITILYRFLTADILPQDVDRVLYLDCDILVRGDISELYDIDLTDMAIAACPEHDGELGHMQEERVAHYTDNLQYPRKYGYFNSGVMLINLEYWREHNVSKQLIDYLAKNYRICYLPDQDVLNAVLHKVKRFVPIKFNLMTHLLLSNSDAIDFILQEDPVIVHYCTLCKPWDFYLVDYPFCKEWKQCRRISPWRNWHSNAPLWLKVRRIIGNIYYRLRGKTRFNYNPAWKKWEKSI